MIVAQEWRQSQAQAKQDKARNEEQEQQALFREGARSKFGSNSPTSSHSSPTAVKLQAQLYEGLGDCISRALLPDVPDNRGTSASSTMLPSLKQAGLLDSLNAKGPSMALCPPFCRVAELSPTGLPPTTNDSGTARSQPNASPGAAYGSLPVSVNWPVDAEGVRRL